MTREAVAAAATARARVVATALPAAQEEGVVAVGEGHAALKQRHENRPSRRRRRWSTRLRVQRRRRWVGAEQLPRWEAEAEAEAAAATGCTRWRQVCAPQPAVVAGCSAREPPCHAVQSEELLARQLAAPHG